MIIARRSGNVVTGPAILLSSSCTMLSPTFAGVLSTRDLFWLQSRPVPEKRDLRLAETSVERC